MNDGLPSDDQLRRIERGVQQRIRGRRQAAHRIAGALVAVVLLAGGVALVRPVLGSSGSGAGSAAGTSGGASASSVLVVCHGPGGTTTVHAPKAGLPASAFDACAPAVVAGAASARPHAMEGRTPTPSPSPAQVLCAASSGRLHVYPGGAATCAQHAMTRVRG